MNVIVWNAPETMNAERHEVPQPQADEVLIRVLGVGICGSEIEGYLGHNSLRVPPLIMGHEICGRVEQNGTGANQYSVGQKVVVNPLLFCGECLSCLKGLTQLCAKRQIVGIHRPGGFAQYTVVPQSTLVPVSESINPYRASLAEPLACSLRAARRAMEHHSFPNVVVFGAGGIGLLCAKVARLLGASEVLIVDTNDERLHMARNIKFDHTCNPISGSLKEYATALFGSKGVDVVIDAAGFQPTRESGMELLSPGGTFMNIGLGIDETKLYINRLIRSEIEILGSFCYTRQDFYDAVQLLEQGVITEEGWTEVRGLTEANAAFQDLVAGKVINGKIFLDPTR
ncbi:zinc-dependent alcohol dehydrogenase [Paenibacillus nasutitermitis]|uniref:Galactonate oxidoreductase n=1 Tax=Paenibacillus nasutitermitis TaxID=1652958 RepID=A0A916Z294_9BACL|nr:alcohol dehydrogenase catalytic domain-containing protein [Paenibacillus nasutitermitis]GGD72612.1 galactonate oxidoreductase [Paenibacillus nasutitermitis]